MKTTLFLFLSLLLWCSFSSFKNDSTRPNGWYYMIDKIMTAYQQNRL